MVAGAMVGALVGAAVSYLFFTERGHQMRSRGTRPDRLYSQTMQTVREIEARQIAPLVARVNTLMTRVDAILVDVKDVTARVSDRTERVDTAIRTTMNRVDETAGRMRSTV